MAARKSCTHLTWGEAKAKSNPGGSSGGGKKKPLPKKMSHSDALAQKIIAKNGASQQALSQHKSLTKKVRRDEERAAAAAARRAEERERERQERVVKPHEQAREQMAALAKQQQQEATRAEQETAEWMASGGDLAEMTKVAQCRALQLDEIMALEAIYDDTDEFLVSEVADLEGLRTKIEDWQLDEENEQLLRSVVEHPPLSYSLQLTIDGSNDDTADIELVASLLLRVTLPRLYPLHGDTPLFKIPYFMVTDKAIVCSADKPLESLAYLEEDKFRSAILDEAKHILPDPCVYELAASWVSESVFSYVVMNAHGHHTKK